MNVLFGIISFLPIVLSNCPDGWLWKDSVCYHFSNENQSMAAAMYLCKVLGGYLVEVNDAAEQTYLEKVIQFYGNNFWIGLNNLQDIHEWMWVHSKKTLNETTYVNWYPGQPDSLYNMENCVYMRSDSSGQWYNAACTDSNRYICEKTDPIV